MSESQSPKNLNKYIDHTILKPETTEAKVIQICKEAKEYQFASVCVNPCYTSLVSKELNGSGVKTCVVIGFPLGSNTSEIKALEAKNAIKNGAEELDMVINVGALKAKNYDYVKNDIQNLVNAANGNACVKVILETCLLTDEEIVKACEISKDAGANYVKTSTGFNSAGATKEHIALMRKTVGPEMGVKASGGIRSYEKAIDMINAGATRIGASSSIKIVEGSKNK